MSSTGLAQPEPEKELLEIAGQFRPAIRDAVNRATRKPFYWGGLKGYHQLESIAAMYFSAKKLLAQMGIRSVKCYFRDGTKGLPEFAPYDKIIVTAGAPVVPDALKQQLAIGGILVIPVGEEVQYMYRIERLSAEEFRDEMLDAFRFVPFLEGVAKKK